MPQPTFLVSWRLCHTFASARVAWVSMLRIRFVGCPPKNIHDVDGIRHACHIYRLFVLILSSCPLPLHNTTNLEQNVTKANQANTGTGSSRVWRPSRPYAVRKKLMGISDRPTHLHNSRIRSIRERPDIGVDSRGNRRRGQWPGQLVDPNYIAWEV